VHKADNQNCFNTWPFRSAHAHNFTDNACVVLYTWEYGHAGALDAGHPGKSLCANVPAAPTADDPNPQCALNLANNSYYTPWANASLNKKNSEVPLAKLQAEGVEVGSTDNALPSNEQIVAWARTKLGMNV